MAEHALLSCHSRKELPPLAEGLHRLGWVLHASGGTAGFLRSLGLPVSPTEEITGVSSILGGRVKTLHPELHAGILAEGEDRLRMIEEGRIVFDMVATDFYPFHENTDLPGDDPSAVELIDVGGPAMARAAAKNYRHVIAATGGDSFGEVLAAVAEGRNTLEFRRRMAARTFDVTASYDLSVSLKLSEGVSPALRYGENPHQAARVHFGARGEGFAAAELLHGDALSYNNYLDAAAAWELVRDLPAGAVVVVKHGNPCCVAVADRQAEAWDRAFPADRSSPYGGVLAVNTRLGEELVERLRGVFLELVIAPDFEPEALERLRTRRKLRVLGMPPGRDQCLQFRSIWGGLLVQEPDPCASEDLDSARVVSARQPTVAERGAMELAWRICRMVKSNAMVVCEADRALGIGAGQMSRIESLDLAVRRASAAGLDLHGSALASDGLIPFRDSIDLASEAGVTAVIQPGGSLRDDEVLAAADEKGMTMLLTGRRHFRH